MIRGSGQAVLELAQQRGFTPFIDLAYQGFGDGLDEDAYGVRLLSEGLPEVILATSCSKNFGLYRERTGALTLLSGDSKVEATTRSQLLNVIRGDLFDAAGAWTARSSRAILTDAALRADWERELAQMRDRINGLRQLLVERFAVRGDGGRFEFIERQRGMFSFLGISPKQGRIPT